MAAEAIQPAAAARVAEQKAAAAAAIQQAAAANAAKIQQAAAAAKETAASQRAPDRLRAPPLSRHLRSRHLDVCNDNEQ